jgi:transcription-repair coupling factor (superfamily II helicase)
MINRVCPDVSTIIAHGQMDGVVLEKTMLDFMEKKYDVLLATTIIESGLDIPNVNTIIVNNANNFGLSTLHQLRGRVGRSNKKAFAYFLTPDPITMTDEARRRLRAIEDFSDLGSGFQISLQDLDIRGAGDVLGGEQSGFIADIGFDTYHRILSEAVQELKENEFKSIFKEEKEINPEAIDNIQFLDDCQIDTDRPLRFPSTYIQNIGERMKLYRSLDNLKNEKELQEFVLQLEDRFGVLPEETRELTEVIRLRKIAIKNGIEQLRLKNNLLKCYFITNQESLFYQSESFTKVLNWLQRNSSKADLREINNKLVLSVKNIKTIYQAVEVLSAIQ